MIVNNVNNNQAYTSRVATSAQNNTEQKGFKTEMQKASNTANSNEKTTKAKNNKKTENTENENKTEKTKENTEKTENKEKNIGTVKDPNTGKEYKPQLESLEALEKRREQMEKEKNKRKNPYSKDTFLQLLVTQMKHQDPLEPMNNEQMLAQMAQFSTVEQLSNLNQSFEKFTKDFYFEDGKGNKVNVLVDQLIRLNGNIEKISANFGTTKNEDGSITTDMDKFLDLYEKTYMKLFDRINSLEAEIKKLSK